MSEGAKPDYSVVIPVLNEEGCIEDLNRRLGAVMGELDGSYEIIYVDDGSTDGTPALLDGFRDDDERVRVVRFTRNFGQHPAVYAGFSASRGETIITLDADLQNPPEEIPKLLEKLAEGYDMVTGVRTGRQDSLLRTLPSRFVNWMIGKLTRVPLRDYGCLLRVYKRGVIEKLQQCREQTVYFTALISWLGVKIAEVEVAHAARAAGRSKYNWLKLITMNFDLLTGYSILPIQIISIGGICMAGLGFLCSLVFLVLGLVDPSSNTIWWLLGFSGLSFLFGLQLVALGFIGEYIGRILIEVKGRPFYILDDRTRDELEGLS